MPSGDWKHPLELDRPADPRVAALQTFLARDLAAHFATANVQRMVAVVDAAAPPLELMQFIAVIRGLRGLRLPALIEAGVIQRTDGAAYKAFRSNPMLFLTVAAPEIQQRLWRLLTRPVSATQADSADKGETT